jgi:hypothetical protein
VKNGTGRLSTFGTSIVAGAILLLTAAPLAVADKTGPDWVSSDNVEYIGSLKPDIGVTTGARIVGDRMFVTSAKNISIYDISTPESPQMLGFLPNASWENEEVPTNGKILAFASDFFSAMPNCVNSSEPIGTGRVTGCVQFFDVRDPANIKEIGITPRANHTAECVLDCQYFYGSAGTIIDARGALDGTAPTEVGNWITYLRENEGVDSRSCHHIRELRPGVLLTACRPFAVITVNPEDAAGASPTTPQVLYTGNAAKFVHSARWPRKGEDDLLMTGGEENFNPQCEQIPPSDDPDDRIVGNNSEFSTYSAEAVNEGTSTEFELLHQVGPAGNGTYADGKPVANHLGCSVHWFQEHRTFKNGGLVALSEYEDGVRFMQIHKDGQIEEQGFFLALGSSSSSPKWAPGSDIVYSIDYDRGIDIIRWNGEYYLPQGKGKGKGGKPDKGKVEGTEGTSPIPALTAEQAENRDRLAAEMTAMGWSAGLCRLAASRQ